MMVLISLVEVRNYRIRNPRNTIYASELFMLY